MELIFHIGREDREQSSVTWRREVFFLPGHTETLRNNACVGRTYAISKCGKCFLLIKFCLGHAYPNGACVTFTGRLREES
ncbi:hypothetical protein MESS2_1530012 [Mesorhizobium metallidurans STM 2683]|uniref:Uncharacterized protein n=1 Tax=Mesorhizobium metallidurans STM 2683 TaxID=1297569 RepID=M5EKL0_9HYPH|nr:hypothetical protein MESS2_1530012 [Mesorhizobium metallidurans STM 2683]